MSRRFFLLVISPLGTQELSGKVAGHSQNVLHFLVKNEYGTIAVFVAPK